MAAHIGADNLDATAQTRSVRASNAGSSTGTISSQGNSANAASNQVSPDANEQSAVDATVGERRGSQRPEATNDGLLVRWFGSPFMPCFLGLAALRVWLQVNQFGGYAQSDNGVITILSNLTYGLTFLIAAAMAWRKPPTPRTERMLAIIAVVLMLAAPLLMLASCSLCDSRIATAGALLVGVAGAFGGGMWACAYTRLPLKPALMYAFASLALGSIGGLAVSVLPEASRYTISLLIPAIAILCYERARTHTGDIPLGGASDRNQDANANCNGQTSIVTDQQGKSGNATAGAAASPALAGRQRSTGHATGNVFATMQFGKAAEHPYDDEPKLSLALIIGGIAVFGLALGLSRGFPAGSPVPFELPVRLVHQLGVVAISAGFLWWIGVKGRRISFSLLWRIEIMIAAVGAFVLMALPGTATEVAVAIINIADSLMLCVLFVTAQDVARHSSMHPYVIFGGAWAARVLSRDFGRTIVFALSPMTISESVTLGFIVFALSLSMVCLLSDNLPRTRKLFTYDDDAKPEAPDNTVVANRSHKQAAHSESSIEQAPANAQAAQSSETASGNTSANKSKRNASEARAAQGTESEAPGDAPNEASSIAGGEQAQLPNHPAAAQPEQPQANPDQQVRDWLRTEHGLTAREIDVALLIAHGRSKTFIANELFISENTVRTHSKNVYAKLGIHSREELISLFENRLNA